MDAKKFGAFVATARKESGMTQADLANKLQVTDKAISRWERGMGFPDIALLEPLSDALGVTVLELLKSEQLNHQQMSAGEVSETVVDAINMAKEQQRSWKQLMITICSIVVLIAFIPIVVAVTGISLLRVVPVIIGLIAITVIVYIAMRIRNNSRQFDI